MNSQGWRISKFIDKAVAYKGDDCLIWPFAQNGGYPVRAYAGKNIRMHSFICEKVHGPRISIRNQAAHSCGRALCVNPKHLRWATAKENIADQYSHGTRKIGARHPQAKLKEADIEAIRKMRKFQSIKTLAQRFCVSEGSIRKIFSGEQWASLVTINEGHEYLWVSSFYRPPRPLTGGPL